MALVLQDSLWSGCVWSIRKQSKKTNKKTKQVCSVPVHRENKWCTKKMISNIHSDDSHWWNGMGGGAGVWEVNKVKVRTRQSYGWRTDIAMICTIKEQVECWTAPRDYHRGDRVSNAAFSLRKTSWISATQGKHELVVNSTQTLPILRCYML